MVILAGVCLFFGVGNFYPIHHFIAPSVSAHLGAGAQHLGGAIPHTWGLVAVSVVTLLLAIGNHWFGAARTKSGLGAVDHIHYAPVAHQLYDAAEKRWFDPYELAMKLIRLLAWIGYGVDRLVDFFYNGIAKWVALGSGFTLRAAHSGGHGAYLVWLLLGASLIVVFFAGGF